MGQNRVQHYVPRVHLKPFSKDPKGKTIGVWLPRSDHIVDSAPIKSQAAKPYFYGEGLVIEKLLGLPEGWYAECLRKILAEGVIPSDEVWLLQYFWSLQRNRSNQAATDQLLLDRELRDRAFISNSENAEEFLGAPMEHRQAVMLSLSIVRRSYEAIADLKVILLRNRTQYPFITGDNPAASANKFYPLKKGPFENWGLISSGLYLLLPLSPTFAFFAYDSSVYHLHNATGPICDITAADAICLNSLLVLHCEDCIYFSSSSSFARVRLSLLNVVKDIPERRIKINLAIREQVEDIGRGTRFRVVEDAEFQTAPEGLIHMEHLPVRPRKHLPSLRLRMDKMFIDTRSGLGLVRPKARWPEEEAP